MRITLLSTGNIEDVPKEQAIGMVLMINGLEYNTIPMNEYDNDSILQTIGKDQITLVDEQTLEYIEGYTPESVMAFVNKIVK